jgi:hypothetical protein
MASPLVVAAGGGGTDFGAWGVGKGAEGPGGGPPRPHCDVVVRVRERRRDLRCVG